MSSLCLTLARSPLVLEIVPAVLSLYRKDFSSDCQESMVIGFSDVNHVKALLDSMLVKALHSMALLVVTRPMDDLYR